MFSYVRFHLNIANISVVGTPLFSSPFFLMKIQYFLVFPRKLQRKRGWINHMWSNKSTNAMYMDFYVNNAILFSMYLLLHLWRKKWGKCFFEKIAEREKRFHLVQCRITIYMYITLFFLQRCSIKRYLAIAWQCTTLCLILTYLNSLNVIVYS